MVKSFLVLILTGWHACFHQTWAQTRVQFPYSVNETHLTVWNGEGYSPLFIKGINLGVAKPGTFPGDLAASKQDYERWFEMIREAGFNAIRVYTLHFPRFYEALRDYNLAHPQAPLLLFQGVWLEEEVPDFDKDLFSLTALFEQEIRENVRAVHGNASIAVRSGKAFGEFTADVSAWTMAYIIGREIHPPEVLHTNQVHAEITSYEGEYLSISGVRATEAWLLARMDYLLSYEMQEFDTQRPVSASSWPTLDPLEHPFELNEYEVSASINFKDVDFSKAKAGFFASYHAYPYYPNYISRDPKYIGFYDHLGQNSYLGYLTYLKEYYSLYPLIIAEYGGSSSWGVAQYAHNGIHHGGYSEREQGENNIRLLKNIEQAGGGGGHTFAWMDEWFKRTWITDPIDKSPDRRVLWHNVTAAEQNFGLIGFRASDVAYQSWAELPPGSTIQHIWAKADYAYFSVKLDISQHIAENDSIWIGIDTYDAGLGESRLPNGKLVADRAEFALLITNHSAQLYVTQAYDLFGIWHNVAGPEQQFQSTVTDGAPWRLVRWKNDVLSEEVQYIGMLKVNRLNKPTASTDGVRLKADHIEIRLPWSLLHVTDPSTREVIHDNRATAETEYRTSDGIVLSIFYKDLAYTTPTRFTWTTWDQVSSVEEYTKQSFVVMKEALPALPGNPVAVSDAYTVGVEGLSHIQAAQGVLRNDLAFDGAPLAAVVHTTPMHGLLQLEPNGAFRYTPLTGYSGADVFTYRAKAGPHWSEPVSVHLTVAGSPTGTGFVQTFPNPATTQVTIESASVIDSLVVYSALGQKVYQTDVNATSVSVPCQTWASGVYFLQLKSGKDLYTKKITVVR